MTAPTEQQIDDVTKALYEARAQTPAPYTAERWERLKVLFPGSIRMVRADALKLIAEECGLETCKPTAYGDECEKTGVHAWHRVSYPNGTSREWIGDRFEGPAHLACVICGEPEGSDYERGCCARNMEEV